MAGTLRHWQRDTDLVSLRNPPDLAKLPEAERAGFIQLWAEVDRLLARATAGP